MVWRLYVVKIVNLFYLSGLTILLNKVVYHWAMKKFFLGDTDVINKHLKKIKSVVISSGIIILLWIVTDIFLFTIFKNIK